MYKDVLFMTQNDLCAYDTSSTDMEHAIHLIYLEHSNKKDANH